MPEGLAGAKRRRCRTWQWSSNLLGEEQQEQGERLAARPGDALPVIERRATRRKGEFGVGGSEAVTRIIVGAMPFLLQLDDSTRDSKQIRAESSSCVALAVKDVDVGEEDLRLRLLFLRGG